MVKVQIDFDDDTIYILKLVKAKMQFNNQKDTIQYIVREFDVNKLKHKK